MTKFMLGLFVFSALTLSTSNVVASEVAFPEYLGAAPAASAEYSCVGQCLLTYQIRHNGHVDSRRIPVGPTTVTVFNPSENGIHAAAQVALTGLCPSACQSNLPSGGFVQSCRVYGTGPCSRVK